MFAELRAFDPFRPGSDHPLYWITRRCKIGGGPLMDFGCHRIEVLLHVLGPIVEAQGMCQNVLTDWEVEDSDAVTFRFANGALGLLMLSRATGQAEDCFHVFGSTGSLHIDRLERGEVRIDRPGAQRTEKLANHRNPHLPCIQAFTEAVLTGGNFPVHGEVGLRVAEIIDQVYRV